jgi:hypothetical protein
METVLPALIATFLILIASLTQAYSYLSAEDKMQTARQVMEERLADRLHTNLSPVGTQVSVDGTMVELILRNVGDTRLVDFDRWDVIVQYYDASDAYHVAWLPYFEGGEPTSGEWSVVGIYASAEDLAREVFDPGIFDPGEEMIVRFRVSPAIGSETTNGVYLSTPNGVGVSSPFVGQP